MHSAVVVVPRGWGERGVLVFAVEARLAIHCAVDDSVIAHGEPAWGRCVVRVAGSADGEVPLVRGGWLALLYLLDSYVLVEVRRWDVRRVVIAETGLCFFRELWLFFSVGAEKVVLP